MMFRAQGRCALALAAALASSSASAQVVIDWVTVGNPGNAADPSDGDDVFDGVQNLGSVNSEYRIGATEVTNAQYAGFLNAVGASDPNGLYNTFMGSDPRGGITRAGASGSYTYSVRPEMGNKPVNFVSWYDAARMANWMTNGQGLNGGSGDTESGVYTLTGPTSLSDITRDISNPGQVFIPTEDEWYKAAYHQPAAQGGDADDYWVHATRSNFLPVPATATATGDIANPGQDVANYELATNWNGQSGNVTTVASAGSTSFYGAFDMNGNVWEWNETGFQVSLLGSVRGLRGGSWFNPGLFLASSHRDYNIPTAENSLYGFRLASPAAPDPCPADLTGEGDVNTNDFFLFLSLYQAMDPRADFAPGGGININDFFAFLAAYQAGC